MSSSTTSGRTEAFRKRAMGVEYLDGATVLRVVLVKRLIGCEAIWIRSARHFI